MNVQVLALESEGILKLVVARPIMLTQMALQASDIGNQSQVLLPHITLSRLDDLCVCLKKVALPTPPEEIELEDSVYYVDNGEKQSTFVNVSLRAQAMIALYLRKCEYIAETKLFQPGQRFHISLTNAGNGDPRASVRDPWNFLTHPI